LQVLLASISDRIFTNCRQSSVLINDHKQMYICPAFYIPQAQNFLPNSICTEERKKSTWNGPNVPLVLSLSSPLSSCGPCHVVMSCFLLRLVDLTIADIKLSYIGRVCLVQFSVLFVLVDATLVCWFIGQRLWSQPGRPCRSVARVTFAKPFCLQVLNGLSI